MRIVLSEEVVDASASAMQATVLAALVWEKSRWPALTSHPVVVDAGTAIVVRAHVCRLPDVGPAQAVAILMRGCQPSAALASAVRERDALGVRTRVVIVDGLRAAMQSPLRCWAMSRVPFQSW